MEAELEAKNRDCTICQEHIEAPNMAPLHPREWPGQLWYRIHIEYASPIAVKWIFIIVDSHSKYLEAHVMGTTTSAVTIS